MTVNQLWTKYQKKRTDKYRNDLVLHYSFLINFYVNKVSCKNKHVQEEELSGAAYLGLIGAVEAFDPERKIKFETFCKRRIYGAIIDWLRELDLQSRTVRIFEKKKQQAEENLSHNGYYGETDIADKMDINYKRYSMLNKLLFHGKEVRISALQNNSKYGTNANWADSNIFDNWETEDTRESDPTSSTNQWLLKEFITEKLGCLERKILVLYYFEGLIMREIAQELGYSESRISQLHSEAIVRVRSNLKKNELLAEIF